MRYMVTRATAALAFAAAARAQSPVWHNTLEDLVSSTINGGVAQGSAPAFPPGVVSPPLTTTFKWQSTADGESATTGGSRLFWNTAAVQAIFGGWVDANGITVDLYFSGFGPGVTRDTGLWCVGHRNADNFLLIAIRDDTVRINIRNDSGVDTASTRTIQTGNLGLVAATTYRLTVRQHVSNGNGGDLEVYLDDVGGNQYSNAAPLATLDLVSNYVFNFPLEAGSGSGTTLGMSIGNRYPFSSSDLGGTVLNAGEAIDEVRVYNGNYTPAQLDTGGLPVAVIQTDKTAGFAPLAVNFNGQASHDTDASNVITSLAWDFEDDGTVDSTLDVVDHVYTVPGVYTARLTVRDDENLTASATVQITVHAPPAAGLVPVTAMTPDGGPLSGSQVLTSITAGGDTFTSLVGPSVVELSPNVAAFGAAGNNGLCGVSPQVERTMFGLELGRGLTNLGGANEAMRAYFPTGISINADGTAKPEIFVLEYANALDSFVVELLTSGPGEAPVIAASVSVRALDYAATTTRMTAFNNGNAPVGGVGVDLDALGVSGIRGVAIPGLDGNGQATGIDLCLVAGVVPANTIIPPVALASAAPTSGGKPLAVTISGCGSFDPDGPLTASQYAWDFNDDGTPDATGLTASHTYTIAGTFTARLTVTDDDGLTASQIVQINVEPSTNPIVVVTALEPDGSGLTGSLTVTSVTAGGYVITGLVGPPDADHVEVEAGVTGAAVQGLPDVNARQALVGLELGYAALGLASGRSIRAYFPDGSAVNPDGTDKPEIIILEWAASTDVFQVYLLTSRAGEQPVIAGVVRVAAYQQTTSVLATKNNGNQPIGGVGINLDALGVGGIAGIEIPGEDGQGGSTGLDPCVIAGLATTCHAPFADADGDGDVDQGDYGAFQSCWTGTLYPGFASGCFCFDRNGNQVIDEFDRTAFEKCATGPSILWSLALTPDCQP